MRTRPRSLLRSVSALAVLATVSAAPAAAQDDAPSAPLERRTDAWPDHALADDEAARQGRAALPFTQDQIETLGKLLRETQQATARGAGDAAQGACPPCPPRRCGGRDPGDRGPARLHHRALLHRHDRRSLAH